MSQTYTLIAKNLVAKRKMDVDDRSVVGTYQFQFDAGRVPEGDVRETILDQFHDSYGIENLDDFDILVFNPQGQIMTSDLGSDAAENLSVGDAVKISDAVTPPVPPRARRAARPR